MSNIDSKFIINLQGKDFITYEGLLDLAHQKGLKGIETKLIQIPDKENLNTCIVQAIAKLEDGEFYGLGDANPSNVNSFISKHLIRMAETRAKARALRDLTNVGMTAIEELGDDVEENIPSNIPPKKTKGNLSDAQIKRLYDIAKSVDIDEKKVKSQVKTKFNKEVSEMTKEEYDIVCKGYEGLKK